MVKITHPLDGKVAIVSGSTRGIGKAIARELVRHGVCVVINGRDQRRVEHTVNELSDAGGTVTGFAGDVANATECEQLVAQAIQSFGGLDYVINNAGVSMEGDVVALAPQVFQQVVETNLLGACYLTKAAIPHIQKTSGGILFVSSCASIHGIPGYSIYCASKMALVGFAESLRIEMEQHGVYVGVALVGFTENDTEKTILGTSGQLVRQPDRPFVRPQLQSTVARQVIMMIEKRKSKHVFSSMGKLASIANRIAPRLYEYVLRRHYIRSHESFSNETPSFKNIFET